MKFLIIDECKKELAHLESKLKLLDYDFIYTSDKFSDLLSICKREQVDLIFLGICNENWMCIDEIIELSKYSTNYGVVINSDMSSDLLKAVCSVCSSSNFKYVSSIKRSSNYHLNSIIHDYNNEDNKVKINNTPLCNKNIINAFEKNLFVNYYQPKIELKTNEIIGVEVLVRYVSENGKVLNPDCFLDSINAMGLSDILFWTVAENALSEISSISSKLNVSLNISLSNLEENISERFISLCEKHNIIASRIILEITENEACSYSNVLLANLAKLRINGVNLSIDDFGTGYACLGHIAHLPFTEIKIDRLFISDISKNTVHQELTNVCVNLAHSLGMHCVAEGVEDADTLEYLKKIGVDSYQGFYMSKPLPFDLFKSFYVNYLTGEKID